MSPAPLKCVRLRITGRVQGVGYRAWTMHAGVRFGVRGWVRNRGDGSVEALVVGDETAVAAMIEACRRGPPPAEVAGIDVADANDDGSAGFAALPTV